MEGSNLPGVAEQIRVDTAGVQAMSGRWSVLVGDLSGILAPAVSGFSCQSSAAAVNAAHADIAALKASLVARVQTRAIDVAEADSRYVANEANSANQLAAVAVSVAV
jgi:hypothetical protein